MTAHRSKGLEFEYVYIVNACDKHWSNKRSVSYFHVPVPGFNPEFDPVEDERRLFYVALTRARKGVCITWCSSSVDGKADILPTQFIEEIADDHKEMIDTISLPPHPLTVPSFSFAPQLNFGINMHDKEFLQKLFLEHGIAVTALNNYLDCPWKWFSKISYVFHNLKASISCMEQPCMKH